MFKNKKQLIPGLRVVSDLIFSYKKTAVLLIVLGVFSALLNGIVPFITGRLFDAILSPERTFTNLGVVIPMYLFLLITWTMVQLITYTIDWFMSRENSFLSEKLSADYIVRGFSLLLEKPMSFHKEEKSGSIGNKINRAGNKIASISDKVITHLAPQFLSVIVAIIISFFLDPLLASIMLAGTSLYVLILLGKIEPLAKLQRRLNKIYTDAYGYAYDLLFNVKEVKQSTSEKRSQKSLFSKFSKRVVPLTLRMENIWHGLNFYQRLLILTTVSIFALSISFIIQGEMTMGELVTFNSYAAMMFGPFVALGNMWNSLQHGLIDISESEKMLNVSPENYIPKRAVSIEKVKGLVEFKKVEFKYKKGNPVLEGISFRVEPGEIVALVGKSGEGKSTLVDLISGYHFAQKGKVLVDGHNVKNINLTYLRQNIALVSQEIVLFNDTIENNIRFGSFTVSKEELRNAAREAHAVDFIEKFPKKWKQLVGERGVKLSVGQKQRVAIARAILRNPAILILDEPTSALDAHTEKSITESLETLMKGRTTFIIAHRLSTVRHADKILVLKDGRIVEQGRHDELIKIEDGEYRKLYDLQIGLHK